MHYVGSKGRFCVQACSALDGACEKGAINKQRPLNGENLGFMQHAIKGV